ncbi:MAG: membrane protein insertion efficiency factor YidD [Planctomycetota bacterium]|nr:MAG: membrane protein insertion efficiency factor YidD [Planctomycetota bacterium]
MVHWILIPSIKLYQKVISPILPPSCRYYPTCSHYAIEALQKKGIILGLLVTIYRILRCNPFSAGGFDPVEKEK